MTNSLPKTLKNYINKNNLATKVLAVACSAGVDSLSLLHACLQVHPLEQIYCLHLDHKLRDNSEAASIFLQTYCQNNQIKFIQDKIPAGSIDINEEAARNARYDFFVATAQEYGFNNILLGHNLNDQAETIIFRLLRGTNSTGLSGIPSKREIHPQIWVHRPWLTTKRKDIDSYAQAQKLNFIHDESNNDLKFKRNHIRHQILSQAAEVNPRYLENIQQLAQLISEEQELLDNLAEESQQQLGQPPWRLEDFRKIPKVLQRKILKKVFSPNLKFIEQFLSAIEDGGFHKINFAKNKYFCIRKKQIQLEKDPSYN